MTPVAVLVAAAHDERPRRGPGVEPVARRLELGSVVGVDDVERGGADQLVGPVPEHRLDRGADPRDGPTGVVDADYAPRVLTSRPRW
jgi:hypothetical protein